MSKEKISTLNVRSFSFLTCHRRTLLRSHKEYEQSLIITVENNGGSLSFELTDLSTKEVIKLDNPETGVYPLSLNKGAKYQLLITASAAKGTYKIQKKTIVE